MTAIDVARKPWLVERLSRLLGGQPLLVERYLNQFGLVLSPHYVAEIAGAPPGKDPIFHAVGRCPVCDQPVSTWTVRASTQRLTTNEFQVVTRAEGTQGHASVNPVLYDVTGCQACLYVSSARSEFKSETGSDSSSPLADRVKKGLDGARAEREAVLVEIPFESIFDRPRDLTSAMLAYQMAVRCEQVKVGFDVPGSHMRLASTRFRLATLEDLAGRTDSANETIAAALTDVRDAYSRTEDPRQAAPAAYLALAAAIRLGEASVASEYLQVLRGLEKTLQADPKLKSSLRWCSQARDLWTDWRQGQ
ncbi:MAG TPA: DUF2225 domain-containing protein [Armatimonadota bacterium]|nr:DUF2225 domain-containing protein [Armatimonadota bacterium]